MKNNSEYCKLLYYNDAYTIFFYKFKCALVIIIEILYKKTLIYIYNLLYKIYSTDINKKSNVIHNLIKPLNDDIYPDICKSGEDAIFDIINQHNVVNEDEVNYLGIDACDYNFILPKKCGYKIPVYDEIVNTVILPIQNTFKSEENEVYVEENKAIIKDKESNSNIFDLLSIRTRKVIKRNEYKIGKNFSYVISNKPYEKKRYIINNETTVHTRWSKKSCVLFNYTSLEIHNKEKYDKLIIMYVAAPRGVKKKRRKKVVKPPPEPKDSDLDSDLVENTPDSATENGSCQKSKGKVEMKKNCFY